MREKDQLGDVNIEELESVGSGCAPETADPNFDLRQEILAQARDAARVTLEGGECSGCGRKIKGPPRNFCPKCFGTFLTDKQIDRGEIYPD